MTLALDQQPEACFIVRRVSSVSTAMLMHLFHSGETYYSCHAYSSPNKLAKGGTEAVINEIAAF